MRHSIEINRAPVLTLWATVVAEQLGFDHDEALTLGRAVAGLNAYPPSLAINPQTGTAVQKFPLTDRRHWCGEFSDDESHMIEAIKRITAASSA